MKRTLGILFAAALLLGIVVCASAQEEEYSLKDYMPQTVGSKWVMKTTSQKEVQTVTIEMGKPRDIAGRLAMPLLTKNADGVLQRGSLETVTDTKLTLFGILRLPHGQQNADLVMTPFTPPVVFPGRMKVGQHAETTTIVNLRGRDNEITMKLDLVAVETVTVPKGTFDDCLKLVYTTAFGQGQVKRTVWYARGVGAVRSEQPSFGPTMGLRVTELVDYQIAPAER